MADTAKLKLLFRDRVGIVADISALLAERRLNILSMEVHRQEDRADVYIEVADGTPPASREDLLKILGTIPDLLELRFIPSLPQEVRENRFRVVLDNIRDGVISIDRDGRVTTINRVAREVLDCRDQSIVGRDIRTLRLPDHAILECLQGKKFSNIKKNLINQRGRFQYLVTACPIRDAAGRIVGAVEIAKDMQEIKQLARSISQPRRITFSDVVGQDPAMAQAISFAQKIAGTDSIIAIRGESGTGKELFARAIHTASGRKGPFVPVNCAALPESLLESELFGYVGGAFTGAHRGGKAGLFETAGDGTIFLDEIAEMAPGPQAKILRVIQDKRVRRIGGDAEIPVNTRIITATNRNLEKMVAGKRFRQDLYYRINVLPIHISPLRERREDIPLLAEHFLFQPAARLGQPAQPLSPAALNKLCRHNWPGNVRELKNVIERAAILCETEQIADDCILFGFEVGLQGRLPSNLPTATGGQSLPELLGRYEREIISEALDQAPSVRQAAKTLGVSHTTLLNKIKKHRLQLAIK